MSGTPVKYYVILPDGQRFGPADISLLNQWAAEGRILPTTMLEQEGSQMRLPASSVPGLALGGQNPYATPPPGPQAGPYGGPHGGPNAYSGYYRAPDAMGDMGHNDLVVAWVGSSVGLALCFGSSCCPPFGFLAIAGPILGLIFSGRAQQKGNPGAMGAKIFSGVVLGLQILALIGYFFFLGVTHF